METIILIVLVCSVLFSFLAMIGSFVVPVVTLIIATYLTQQYQKELGEKADELGSETKKFGKKAMNTMKKMMPTNKEQKSMEALKKEICKTIDAKTANVAKQQQKAMKKVIKSAIDEVKAENPGQTDVVSTVLSKIL